MRIPISAVWQLQLPRISTNFGRFEVAFDRPEFDGTQQCSFFSLASVVVCNAAGRPAERVGGSAAARRVGRRAADTARRLSVWLGYVPLRRHPGT